MSKNTELDAIRAELAELRARVTAGDAPTAPDATATEVEARRAELLDLVQRWPAARQQLADALTTWNDAKRKAEAVTRDADKQMPKRSVYMNAAQRAAHDKACEPLRARIRDAWAPAREAEHALKLARAEVAGIESRAAKYGNPQLVLRGDYIDAIARHGRLTPEQAAKYATVTMQLAAPLGYETSDHAYHAMAGMAQP